MAFEENTLLFGSDPTPRIVAIELGDTGTVKVYRREKDGSTSPDIEPFHPFVWCDSDVTDLNIDAEKLAGDLRYAWRVSVNSWKELIALRNGLKSAGRSFFALSDPVQHYLTATGRTLFKGLPFEELRRLQVEVLSFVGGETEIPDASQPSDHIMSIALSDNSGWEEVIVVDPAAAEESERAALKRLTAIIKERDPDVIEGHNLFRFDLPYLVARARKAKVKLDWGRSGGFLRSRPSRLQIAEKTIDYPKFTIDGRHFVDTFLLAQFYDVGMRSLSGFERIDVAQHFGLTDEAQISSLSGKELQRAYLEDADRFRQRALCAVRETRAVADLLSPSYFIQAQIFPYNYQDVIVRGNATRINALFLREYYRQRHSIPEMPMVRGFEGGYTAIFFTGVARNVWHCDIASLYPSVMLQFDCFPVTDQLQIFPASVDRSAHLPARSQGEHALRRRPETAAIFPRAPKHVQNPDQQLLRLSRFRSGKLCRFRRGRARHPDRPRAFAKDDRLAERARCPGHRSRHRRHLFRSARRSTSFQLVVPRNRQDAGSTIEELRRGLAAELPPGIEVEFDEQFEAMFSYKAKNYALLARDGEVIIKGGALKSRGLEKFQRLFLEEMIKLLMEGKPEGINDLRTDFERKIREREMPIAWLMKTDTLQDSLEKYRQKIAGSARNRAAAYELALASGRNYKPGEQISYYITGTTKKVAAYENAKLASAFDPQNRDENIDYYIAKLDELVKKFGGVTADASSAKQASLAL